jgi:hypothetical protein
MEAAGLSIDLDRYARYYNRTFMMNDGRPGGVLAVKGNISPETEAKLQARFGGGYGTHGRTAVIEADSMSWADTSGHPRDMQWVEMMDRMQRDATIAFGVPISLLGDASGRTFDNADAEYASFWENPMLPLLGMVDSQLDALTPSGYDDDEYFCHSTDDVWVLGRHRRDAADRAAREVEMGASTIDDYRVVTGREPLNIPATRVLYLPPGKIVAAPHVESDVAAVAALPMVGSPQEPDVGDEAHRGAYNGAALATRTTTNTVAALRADLTRRALPGGLQTKALPHTDGEGEQSGARAPHRR